MTTQDVKIQTGMVTRDTGRPVVVAKTPYDGRFRRGARSLGGKWYGGSRKWVFDARREREVRDLCRAVWGTDGDDDPVLVDVRVDFSKACLRSGLRCDEVRMYGRTLAKRWGRDDPVRLGEGVRVVSGGFPGQGGSWNYPELEPLGGTVLEVLDVPETLVGGRYAEYEVGAERVPMEPGDEELARRLSERWRTPLFEAAFRGGDPSGLPEDEAVLAREVAALGEGRRGRVLARTVELRRTAG